VTPEGMGDKSGKHALRAWCRAWMNPPGSKVRWSSSSSREFLLALLSSGCCFDCYSLAARGGVPSFRAGGISGTGRTASSFSPPSSARGIGRTERPGRESHPGEPIDLPQHARRFASAGDSSRRRACDRLTEHKGRQGGDLTGNSPEPHGTVLHVVRPVNNIGFILSNPTPFERLSQTQLEVR